MLVFLSACNLNNTDDSFIIDTENITPFTPQSNCHSTELIDTSVLKQIYSKPCEEPYLLECETESIEEIARISISSFEKMPFFCLNVPDKLYYKSEMGDYQAFEVILKDWYYDDRLDTTRCDTDSLNYCYINENAQITIKGLNALHFITFSLQSYLNTQSFQTESRISISNLDESKFESLEATCLAFFQIENTSRNNCVNFHDSIELNGQIYTSVYEGNSRDIGSINKIFYSEVFGLVAFYDQELILWTLVIE